MKKVISVDDIIKLLLLSSQYSGQKEATKEAKQLRMHSLRPSITQFYLIASFQSTYWQVILISAEYYKSWSLNTGFKNLSFLENITAYFPKNLVLLYGS